MWYEIPALMAKAFGVFLLIAFVAPVVTAGTALFAIIYLPFPAPELPDRSRTSSADHPHPRRQRREIGVLRRFDTSIPVQQSDIPDITKAAVVAAEDKRFYSHNGFDLIGAMRAAWADFRGREVVQGGSTITQQYIKKVYVGDDRTLSRKIREAVLAGQLDRKVEQGRDPLPLHVHRVLRRRRLRHRRRRPSRTSRSRCTT